MTFPFYLHVGPWTLHPHVVFEALAYFIGARVYWRLRRPSAMTAVNALAIVAGAAAGAALLSKAVCWFEDPSRLAAHWRELDFWLSGKTIVGGLLGGLIGVELTKKLIGWTQSTGNDFVYPLIVGMSIGRIGCFLTGLPDHTYGTATSLPFGVDFGDGIPRHPTQLYEIVFLLLLGIWLARREHVQLRRHLAPAPDGVRFQLFMAAYLLFRFFIDFIKPTPHPYAGLNNIQIACLLGLLYYADRWRKRRQWHKEQENAYA